MQIHLIHPVLKKTPKSNPYFLTAGESNTLSQLEVEIHFSAEMDEFWNFVQTKSNQRWTWYAIVTHHQWGTTDFFLIPGFDCLN
jgi:hypothetical protein